MRQRLRHFSFDRVACCKTHLTAVATARLDQESDGRPMYLQIMEQIKQKVAVEEWTPGYEISSIRTDGSGAACQA